MQNANEEEKEKESLSIFLVNEKKQGDLGLENFMKDYIFSNLTAKENLSNNNNNIENNNSNVNNKEIASAIKSNCSSNNNNFIINKTLKIKNKLNKNKYFIALISLIIVLYYIFLFYSIFPLYEASCIYQRAHSERQIKHSVNNETDLANNSRSFNNKNINHLKKIRNIENPMDNNVKDEEKFVFSQDKIIEISKMLVNNKGFFYLSLFNISYFLFMVSICRLAIMDPGKLDTEYKSVYSVKQYCEFYFNFCSHSNNAKQINAELEIEKHNLLLTHDLNNNYNNENNYNNNVTNHVSCPSNILLDNLKLFVRSKSREINLKIKADEKSKQLEIEDGTNNNDYESNQQRTNTNCDEQDEINISGTDYNSNPRHNKPEKYLDANLRIKNFDNLIEKFRSSDKLKPYWDLVCQNFSTKSLYENICKYCVTIKPERGYHCKMCKSCIKTLDHHCFIINNCIGFDNYKIFMNMLFYALTTLMVICMAMIETFKIYLNDVYFDIFQCAYMIGIVVVILLGSVLLYYFIFHLNLILKGISQYEYMFNIELKEEKYFESMNNHRAKFTKFTDVFGSNPFIWFLPLSKFFLIILFLEVKSRNSFDGYKYETCFIAEQTKKI